ncbi:MAG TPA: permease prefix domain 1-containing protein [Edaphobacter sp.]|nr:permease prefix domain 1-containing protein [Edaphobacter sp.]
MEVHLAMQAEDNLRAGMTPTEAHRQAALTLGAVEAIRERYRSAKVCFPLLKDRAEIEEEDVVFTDGEIRRVLVVR